jgi:nucleoside-diphosphate-sugar epimerase
VGALPYRQNEVWRLVGDNDKARRMLGWSPRVRLEDGLRQTWDSYRK